MDLDTHQRHEARDGDLCELKIHKYPAYVDEADYQMVHAEQFFKIARSHYENRVGNVQIIMRCHGISPENRPLGSRDYIIDYPDLKALDWIREVKALWPFRQDTAGIIFVQQMSYWNEAESVPIMHVIVSYAKDREGKPILVSQTLHEVHTDSNIHELWAVVVRETANEDTLKEDLSRSPFWFHEDRRTQIYRENRRLHEVGLDWSSGDVASLVFNVIHKSGMLGALREMGASASSMHYEDTDGTGFLQTHIDHRPTLKPFDDLQDADVHFSDAEIVPQRCLPRQHEVWAETYQAYQEAVHAIFQDEKQPTERPVDDASFDSSSQTGQQNDICPGDIDPDGMLDSLSASLRNLTCSQWQGLNDDFTWVPCHHPMVEYAMTATSLLDVSEDAEVYHVYTDGSSKGKTATWAFVILKEYWKDGTKSFARIAFAAGDVCEDIGPYNRGAIDAEATAIIALSECMLSQTFHGASEIHIHYDAIAVGHSAVGKQQLPKNHKSNASFRVKSARIMISLLQRTFAKVCGFHVHSHEGNPFNETADSIASAVREGSRPPKESVLRSKSLLLHPLVEWAWMQVSPSGEIPDLHHVLTHRQQTQPNEAWADSVFQASECFDRNWGNQRTIDLKIGTANVGTMGYKEQDGLAMGHKTAELMQQFQTQEYDIVALQETRSRETQTLQQGPFTRLISQAKAGQGGLEVWTNKQSLEQKLGTHIEPMQDFTVWHHDARCLAIALNLPGLDLNVISIYAPQSGRANEEILQWWKELRDIVSKRPEHPICLLGDCNAKVGSVMAECVGTFAPDFEDLAGTCLREMCEDLQLIIPSTMECYHTGESATFSTPLGNSSRIDYIAVSTCCQPGIVSSSVDEQIDLLNGERDHKVLQLHLQLGHVRQKQGMTRMPLYDRDAARGQQHKDQESVIRQLPSVEWATDPNQHWSLFRDCLQQRCSKQYPRIKRKKRQLYLNEQVWALVCDRKDLRQQHRAQIRDYQYLILKQCFAAWAQRNQEADELDVEICTSLQQQAVTLEARQNLDRTYRRRKAENWKEWIASQTSKTARDANQSKGASLFHVLKPKEAIAKHQGKMKRPLPGLQTDEGRWVHGRTQISLEWQKQFSSVENAVTKRMQDMIEASKPKHIAATAITLTEIPTLYGFEASIRGLSEIKAPGLDNIGGEIYRQDPVQTAFKFYPMFLKCALRQQWITEFSGGWLIPLHKGKMAMSKMEGYRGILLEPSMGRCFGKTRRPKIEEGFASTAAPGQWGGRRGLSIEALHLNLRLAQSTARSLHKSFAMIFVDIRAAFYSIAKPLLCSEGLTPAEASLLCHVMKIPPSATQAFMTNMYSCKTVARATKSDVTEGMVHATLSQSWFCIPNGADTNAPMTGSRPGDPCADTLFGLIMSVILQEIQDRLMEDNIYPTVPNDNVTLAPSLTWVDDTVFLVQSEAAELCGKVEMVLSTVLDVMQEHGLQLSFGPNKTAVILEFSGKASKKEKQASEAKYKGAFHVVSEHQPPVKVPIVQHYRYLGGFMVRGGMITPEIRGRSAQTMAKMKGLRKILQNKQLDTAKKRLIVKSIAFPILSLHAGSWFDLTQGDYYAWKSAVFKLYGILQARGQDGQYHHTDLYDRAYHMQASMPMEWLMAKRLQLCAQILKEGDAFIFSAIVYNHQAAGNSSWLHAVQIAFHWLGEQIGKQPIPYEVQFLDRVATWHELQPYAIKLSQQVRKAMQAHQHRIRTLQEFKEADSSQKAIYKEMGWTFKGPNPIETAEPEHRQEDHRCSSCEASFPSPAALAVHEQRTHNVRMAVRRFAPTPACVSCKKWYHTRPRLLLHLQWSGTKCWYEIMRHHRPMDAERTEALDEQDRLKGEALHQSGLKTYERDQTWRWATDAEIRTGCLQRIPDVQFAGEPRDQEIETWSHYGVLPPGRGGRDTTKRKCQDKTIHNVIADTNQLEDSVKASIQDWEVCRACVPKPMSEGRLFFLIFFAGHRRAGDMATWIARETNLIPVPIDTAIHEHFGNVFRSDLWIQLLRARKVAGGHAGPPCETFSLARWNVLESESQKRQPRPLRDATHPWGLPYRNLKEVFQTMVGTTLYARVLTILLLIHCHHGCFTLEHPAGPSHDEKHRKWSIWQSAFALRALRDPQIARIQFLQGPLGRPFAKPTGLLVSRLPLLARSLYRGYQPGWKASVRLGGKSDDGKWKTHAAKEYPEAMCRILAREYGWFEGQLTVCGCEAEPQGLEEALHHLTTWPETANFVQCMREDFQPHLVI